MPTQRVIINEDGSLKIEEDNSNKNELQFTNELLPKIEFIENNEEMIIEN